MEQIKDFRRKQGNLEFFFLSLVRADSKEEINFLINYGRTLQLGGKDYAGVNEIDLDAEIACNADRLDVIRQFAKDGLKSPKPINVFKLPKIKKMMDNGVVNGHEVTLLQVISDSLISIMENNKTLFKSLIKKYTKDETDTGDNEPQQGGIDAKEIPDSIVSIFKPTFKDNGIIDKNSRNVAKEYLDSVRGCSLSVCADVYNEEYGAKGKAITGKEWGKKKKVLYNFLVEHIGAAKDIVERTFDNKLE